MASSGGFPREHGPRRDRQDVRMRHSHASHDQSVSTAPTMISKRGAGAVRLPSDRVMKLKQATLTREQYDAEWEKLYGTG